MMKIKLKNMSCVLAFVCSLFVAVGCRQAAARTQELQREFVNSIGMEFVLIEAGSFQMGSDPNKDRNASYDETQHKVTIRKPFYIGKFEVTQAQWEAVMGDNPSKFKGQNNPVERVSWGKVQDFIAKLNEMESTKGYRLPTEAEWEYAARAGTATIFSFGDDPAKLGDYAWHSGNSGSATHPVGEKKPNPWGLYDVHGNVYEWVSDWHEKYSSSSATDPKGPSKGFERVTRGGAWNGWPEHLRSARRDSYGSPETFFNYDQGFRLAITVGK
ncbi:MAG: formylglycine-generating enzyme family protein [Deltaproteobacteria bacterium]|jgi:formylglycine-generating enzyme required for sulfatase activity|nr:formylglycine-generating enzyme family protein [Deltaproteobacteria bacterium]